MLGSRCSDELHMEYWNVSIISPSIFYYTFFKSVKSILGSFFNYYNLIYYNFPNFFIFLKYYIYICIFFKKYDPDMFLQVVPQQGLIMLVISVYGAWWTLKLLLWELKDNDLPCLLPTVISVLSKINMNNTVKHSEFFIVLGPRFWPITNASFTHTSLVLSLFRLQIKIIGYCPILDFCIKYIFFLPDLR